MVTAMNSCLNGDPIFFNLQEIREKAPLIKKQREDYEASLKTVSQLSTQLDAAMLVSSAACLTPFAFRVGCVT